MKCLDRNRLAFFYALYEGREPIEDAYGNAGGEYNVKHGHPNLAYANISAAKGKTQTQQFGENEYYDKVIVMDDTSTPIDEYAVLWVDVAPVMEENGSTDTPYDYVVKKVAKSINSISVAISKVNVSYGQEKN